MISNVSFQGFGENLTTKSQKRWKAWADAIVVELVHRSGKIGNKGSAGGKPGKRGGR